MVVDKNYCMSSFLQFRFVEDTKFTFYDGVIPRRYYPEERRFSVTSPEELTDALRDILEPLDYSKTALMLSGGIDSALLAKFVPQGTRAYTLKCEAPGAINEIDQATRYAEACALDLKIVSVTWDDYLNLSPKLVRSMGQPVHSIEPQICKAAQQAKADGYDALIFGETADIIFGGHDSLLSKDWGLDDFIKRHNFVDPREALKDGYIITEPYERYLDGGKVDVYGFLNDIHLRQSPASYINACSLAGMRFIAPYAQTRLATPLDIGRIRSGDSKYIIREAFARYYPDYGQPVKVPLPRALNIWLDDYEGPTRDEFILRCTDSMTPDQKWYIYILELFMNEMEKPI